MNNLFSHTTTTDTKKTNFNRHFLFALVLSLGFSACKKEYIEVGADQTGTPVFETTFNLEGGSQEFIAGDADYYMHTDYTTDADDVMVYKGNFALESCTDEICNASIQFELRSTQLADKTDPANDMMVTNYGYKDDTAPVMDSYSVLLEGTYEEDNLERVEFNFGEGKIVEGASIIYNFLDDPSILLPQFTVKSKDGHYTSKAKQIYFNESSYCSANFEVIQNLDGSVQFESISEGQGNVIFTSWSDGNGGGGSDPIFIPNLDSLLLIEYNLTMIYDDGCYSEITRTFSQNSNNELSYANSDFTAEVLDKHEGGSRLGLSTFTVQYVDDNGTVYRSDWGEQGTDHYFRVTSVETYKNNENNQATNKLAVEYDCRVFAQDGSSLRIRDGIGTIAVAYPN